MLLDEPTTALDIGHQQEVLELVDELRHERGLTVLSTMHDLTLAGQFADRLVLLDDGRSSPSGRAASAVLTEEHLRATTGPACASSRTTTARSVVPARLPRDAG